MKQVKEWKEPWKKMEPGGRLSSKAKRDEREFERQRAEMEEKSTQNITIICNKNLFLTPGLFRSFTVRMSVPISQEEINERMKAAFPELNWGET